MEKRNSFNKMVSDSIDTIDDVLSDVTIPEKGRKSIKLLTDYSRYLLSLISSLESIMLASFIVIAFIAVGVGVYVYYLRCEVFSYERDRGLYIRSIERYMDDISNRDSIIESYDRIYGIKSKKRKKR